jgi:hypothetical protein
MVADRPDMEPGPVESGVDAEIAGLAEARPGLAQVALAMARADPLVKSCPDRSPPGNHEPPRVFLLNCVAGVTARLSALAPRGVVGSSAGTTTV